MIVNGTLNLRRGVSLKNRVDVYQWCNQTIARRWPAQQGGTVRPASLAAGKVLTATHAWITNAPTAWRAPWRTINCPLGRSWRDVQLRCAYQMVSRIPNLQSFAFDHGTIEHTPGYTIATWPIQSTAPLPWPSLELLVRTTIEPPRPFIYTMTPIGHYSAQDPKPGYHFLWSPLWYRPYWVAPSSPWTLRLYIPGTFITVQCVLLIANVLPATTPIMAPAIANQPI